MPLPGTPPARACSSGGACVPGGWHRARASPASPGRSGPASLEAELSQRALSGLSTAATTVAPWHGGQHSESYLRRWRSRRWGSAGRSGRSGRAIGARERRKRAASRSSSSGRRTSGDTRSRVACCRSASSGRMRFATGRPARPSCASPSSGADGSFFGSTTSAARRIASWFTPSPTGRRAGSCSCARTARSGSWPCRTAITTVTGFLGPCPNFMTGVTRRVFSLAPPLPPARSRWWPGRRGPGHVRRHDPSARPIGYAFDPPGRTRAGERIWVPHRQRRGVSFRTSIAVFARSPRRSTSSPASHRTSPSSGRPATSNRWRSPGSSAGRRHPALQGREGCSGQCPLQVRPGRRRVSQALRRPGSLRPLAERAGRAAGSGQALRPVGRRVDRQTGRT